MASTGAIEVHRESRVVLFSAPPETRITKIGNSGSQSRLTRQTDRHV